jgi:predicted transcriptional regulator
MIGSDYAYDILSNTRRRRTIEYLSKFDVGQEVDVRDIADHLSTSGSDRTACYIALIQSHLTQLDGEGCEGLIDYNERAKKVTVRPELHTLYRAHTDFKKEIN